jgi:hypothetical protein
MSEPTDKSLPPVKYTLVCDDIREEKSNKMILVGVYSNRIIIDSLPGMISKLAMRICFDVSAPCAEELFLAIQRPDGTRIGPLRVVVPPAQDEFMESSINVSIVPFPLDAPGMYEIVARTDVEERVIGKFLVESRQGRRDRLI